MVDGAPIQSDTTSPKLPRSDMHRRNLGEPLAQRWREDTLGFRVLPRELREYLPRSALDENSIFLRDEPSDGG